MKKLIIDARNGIAGDITCAGMIGLGASQDKIIKAMEYAGNQIGKTSIMPNYDNNVLSLDIKMDVDHEHLHESKAKELLSHIVEELDITGNYKKIAQDTLDVLCKSERYVHSHDERLAHMMHSHHHHNHRLRYRMSSFLFYLQLLLLSFFVLFFQNFHLPLYHIWLSRYQ